MNQGSLFQAVPSRSKGGGGTRLCPPPCGRPFVPYSRAEGYQKYCSEACRVRHWKQDHGEVTGRDALARLPAFEPYKLHRPDDPITSHDAAEAAGPLRDRHFGVILETLRAYGGGTSEEISDRSALGYWAVARRMGELRDAGRVIQTQEKRPNKSGRMAVVWEPVGKVE